jgi:hypothetical protein
MADAARRRPLFREIRVSIPLFIMPAVLVAQQSGSRESSRPTEANSPSIRAECMRARLAVEEKGLLGRDAETVKQLYAVGRCSESAGAVLPGIWRSHSDVAPDSSALSALIGASSNMRDGRTASTLTAIATDHTKPQLMRQAAIAVLSIYVKPRLRCHVERSGVKGEEFDVGCANYVDVGVADGATPVDGDLKARVAQVLDEIATERSYVSLARLALALRGETISVQKP